LKERQKAIEERAKISVYIETKELEINSFLA